MLLLFPLAHHFLLERNRIRSPQTATIDYGRTETRYIDFDTLLANHGRAIELSVLNATEVKNDLLHDYNIMNNDEQIEFVFMACSSE